MVAQSVAVLQTTTHEIEATSSNLLFPIRAKFTY